MSIICVFCAEYSGKWFGLYGYHCSDNPLCHHSVNNLLKSCDIGASNIVACYAVAFGSVISLGKNIDHDTLQLGINLIKGPGKPLAVLAHFQSRGGNTAGIRSLTRHKQHVIGQEEVSSLSGGWHIGTFCHGEAAIGLQGFGII